TKLMGKQMDKDENRLARLRQLRGSVERNYVAGSEFSHAFIFPVIVHGNRRRSSLESQPLPDYSEYMRLIDEAIEREGLSSDDRVIARAFAIAVYRRALANRLMSDVKILASE